MEKKASLRVTQKWVVKEKEPKLVAVNMADRASGSSTLPRSRPRIRSITKAQARRLESLIQPMNLDEVIIESNSSGDDDAFIQSTKCSSRARTLSLLYPHQ